MYELDATRDGGGETRLNGAGGADGGGGAELRGALTLGGGGGGGGGGPEGRELSRCVNAFRAA